MANFNFAYDLYDFDAKGHYTLLFKSGVARQTQGELTQILSPTKKGLVKFLAKLEHNTSGQYPSEADIQDISQGVYKL